MSNTAHTELWQQALQELAGQMTRATFDTWLRDTWVFAVEDDGQTLVIAVKNTYAIEWLENRLYRVIERTLRRLSGNDTMVRFIVADHPESESEDPQSADLYALVIQLLADPDARKIVEEQLGIDNANAESTQTSETHLEPFDDGWQPPPMYDTKKRWMPLHEYAACFWGAYLGPKAFRLWETIRRCDTRREKTDWTPPRRFSIPQLAREVGCGKQALIGVDRACAADHPGAFRKHARQINGQDAAEERWYYHQSGALDRLVAAGVAEVRAYGRRRHRTYEMTVRTTLGWLTPAQLAALDDDLQTAHDAWVTEAGEDPAHWY